MQLFFWKIKLNREKNILVMLLLESTRNFLKVTYKIHINANKDFSYIFANEYVL